MQNNTQKKEYTKYEIARILGARGLQISMNAPLLLKIEKEKLEEIKYDPLKIAEMEFDSGVLPITVKRPLPVKADSDEESEEDEEPEEHKTPKNPEIKQEDQSKQTEELSEEEEEEIYGGPL